MALTSCRIVYTSKTGNTAQLALLLKDSLEKTHVKVVMHDVEKEADRYQQREFTEDAILFGTYSWGNGDIPRAMSEMVSSMQVSKHTVTGIFGTGDRFYPNFCGAVDQLVQLIQPISNLAVTMKVELLPQQHDALTCEKFVHKLHDRAKQALTVSQ
ncbi:flavodoxin domain-containing protein [Paenalkalicoccus suaedae]|uniref:Flavodoxin domain-containing protein n=1 Tax=Paenalkalicoccus suaedae TaxID=2592382 RepID=A0A859FC18_9BACI|nr:flavodoxin domain-containing protein [Paenalkalicoccus suaedae]QKS70597.1 flavodoxin domain-containing protein [Paenalkalicoccus suaedae]